VEEEEKKEKWVRVFRIQMELGVSTLLRQIAVVDRDLAERLAREMATSLHYFLTEKKVAAGVIKQEKKENKKLFTLEREKIILEFLLARAGKIVGFKNVAEIFSGVEPTLHENNLVTILDRLKKKGAIERPGKGRYTASSQSADYLWKVVDEIGKRS
jgi:hypothetical protein